MLGEGVEASDISMSSGIQVRIEVHFELGLSAEESKDLDFQIQFRHPNQMSHCQMAREENL